MDEPTVGLDPKQMADFRELMVSLGRDHTVLLSSHILSEVSEVCESLIIFNHGRVVAQGTAASLEAGIAEGDRFNVKLHAAPDAAMALIRGLEGVSSVENRSEAAADAECCLLSVEGRGEGLRERMFRALAAADMPILELNSARMTLEQVFLSLTDDAAGTGEGAAQ